MTIALLEHGDVDELSLDHDLGLVDESGRELTGYDVLLWIEAKVVSDELIPPNARRALRQPAGARTDAARN